MLFEEAPRVSLIRPHIFIGTEPATRDAVVLLDNKIVQILHIHAGSWPNSRPQLLQDLNIELEELILPPLSSPEDTIPPALYPEIYQGKLTQELLPWIAKAERQSRATMIASFDGKSRAPALTIAYLIWGGMNWQEAFRLITLKCPVAIPTPGTLASFLQCIGHSLPPEYRDWWKERMFGSAATNL